MLVEVDEVDEEKEDRVTQSVDLVLICFGCCNFLMLWLELPLVSVFSALKYKIINQKIGSTSNLSM